jgi:hypothetical protein
MNCLESRKVWSFIIIVYVQRKIKDLGNCNIYTQFFLDIDIGEYFARLLKNLNETD